MNETKRQHYVPQTYLKHFSIERSDNFFIKALPKIDCSIEKIIEMNISNVCLKNGLYTLTGNTLEKRMLIETFYSDTIETHYNRIYEILIDQNKKTLTESERRLIISTVVTMLYRTTKWINTSNDLFNRVLERLYLLCKHTGKDYFIYEKQKISIAGKTLKQIQNESKNEGRESQVLTQLQVALKLINLRTTRDNIFVKKLIDDDCEYITSDNPVIFYRNEDVHASPFDFFNTLKLPLDKKHMLYLMPYGDDETKQLLLRSNSIGTMCLAEKLTSNYQQFMNSERFLLGEESSLRNYIKTKKSTET